MDPLLDARLKAIEIKLEKNHQILMRIRRVQRNAQIFKVFYWILILLVTVGAFYYIQPYINQLMETYTGIQDSQAQFTTSLSDFGNISDVVKQFKGE